MNEASSRSHALLQLQVKWTDKKGKSFGVLNMVDLAGSEGMKKTGNTGQNAKEGIKINLSLTKLAFVVKVGMTSTVSMTSMVSLVSIC